MTNALTMAPCLMARFKTVRVRRYRWVRTPMTSPDVRVAAATASHRARVVRSEGLRARAVMRAGVWCLEVRVPRCPCGDC